MKVNRIEIKIFSHKWPIESGHQELEYECSVISDKTISKISNNVLIKNGMCIARIHERNSYNTPRVVSSFDHRTITLGLYSQWDIFYGLDSGLDFVIGKFNIDDVIRSNIQQGRIHETKIVKSILLKILRNSKLDRLL